MGHGTGDSKGDSDGCGSGDGEGMVQKMVEVMVEETVGAQWRRWLSKWQGDCGGDKERNGRDVEGDD